MTGRDNDADIRSVDADIDVDTLLARALRRDAEAERRDRAAEQRDDLALLREMAEARHELGARERQQGSVIDLDTVILCQSALDRVHAGRDRDEAAADRADLIQALRRAAKRRDDAAEQRLDAGRDVHDDDSPGE